MFFFCSHWSLVDAPLIFFCPAHHVPDWQPRILLGMVEARSVNVNKTTTTTAWINWVRLPILLVVSSTGKMNISLLAFAPENLVSQDGFDSCVPRQPAHLHTQAESGAYVRDSSRVPRRRPFIYLKTAIRHRVSPEFIGSRSCVPIAFTAESPPAQGQ